MKTLLKIICGTLCAFVAVHLISLFAFHFDENFSARAFEHGFEKSYTQTLSNLEIEPLDAILAQRFFYLANGKQMTAFASEDGNYVLKLFNPMRPLKPNWYRHFSRWRQYSSLKWISREWFGKKARLKKLFLRNRLAYEKLKDETGLVYAHLKPSKKICHYIHITNKKGEIDVLCLEKTPFVLQKRAELVPERLRRLMKENDEEGLEQMKQALETLFARRIEEGITDRIQSLCNNYGFVGERAIQIDFGRIRYEPEMEKREERARIMNGLNEWLTQNVPSASH